MVRIADSTDRAKMARNFRMNLEILDGKIRRGEKFFDCMPLLDAVSWEDSGFS